MSLPRSIGFAFALGTAGSLSLPARAEQPVSGEALAAVLRPWLEKYFKQRLETTAALSQVLKAAPPAVETSKSPGGLVRRTVWIVFGEFPHDWVGNGKDTLKLKHKVDLSKGHVRLGIRFDLVETPERRLVASYAFENIGGPEGLNAYEYLPLWAGHSPAQDLREIARTALGADGDLPITYTPPAPRPDSFAATAPNQGYVDFIKHHPYGSAAAAAGFGALGLGMSAAIALYRRQSRRLREALQGRLRGPLLARIETAIRDGQEVEVFLRGSKEKRVGRFERVQTRRGPALKLTQTQTAGGEILFDLAKIERAVLQIRPRDEDMTGLFSRVENPQFADKSVNMSGLKGENMWVLVDFSDHRLADFLETNILPIRNLLDAGEIAQRAAAENALRVVHDFVPYDRPRVMSDQGLPKILYLLGDFVKKGVCNERGMLLQVCLQYLGIQSSMEKGRSLLGGRHAWVRAYLDSARLILDPQMSDKPIEVGKDSLADRYKDDNTAFGSERMLTAVLRIAKEVSGIFSISGIRRVADRPVPPPLPSADIQLPFSVKRPGSAIIGRKPGPGGISIPGASPTMSRQLAEIGIVKAGWLFLRPLTGAQPVFFMRGQQQGGPVKIPAGESVFLGEGDEVIFDESVFRLKQNRLLFKERLPEPPVCIGPERDWSLSGPAASTEIPDRWIEQIMAYMASLGMREMTEAAAAARVWNSRDVMARFGPRGNEDGKTITDPSEAFLRAYFDHRLSAFVATLFPYPPRAGQAGAHLSVGVDEIDRLVEVMNCRLMGRPIPPCGRVTSMMPLPGGYLSYTMGLDPGQGNHDVRLNIEEGNPYAQTVSGSHFKMTIREQDDRSTFLIQDLSKNGTSVYHQSGERLVEIPVSREEGETLFEDIMILRAGLAWFRFFPEPEGLYFISILPSEVQGLLSRRLKFSPDLAREMVQEGLDFKQVWKDVQKSLEDPNLKTLVTRGQFEEIRLSQIQNFAKEFFTNVNFQVRGEIEAIGETEIRSALRVWSRLNQVQKDGFWSGETQENPRGALLPDSFLRAYWTLRLSDALIDAVPVNVSPADATRLEEMMASGHRLIDVFRRLVT